jgi:hydrogenase-4 component F
MIVALVLVPFIAGILAFMIRPHALRRGLMVLTALGHLGLTALVWVLRPGSVFGGWLFIDPLGIVFLGITSLLFCAAAFYAVRYLKREGALAQDGEEGDFLFNNAPEAVFTGCLLIFMASMSLVIMSQHFGILWVGMEATTLVSAPLIYFHRHPRSLEATWKYLLICSVGIALALLGNLFLAMAGTKVSSTLFLPELLQQATALDAPWLKAAFLFLFVGYGTKMGLAPFHAWLPDAHSEAPSVVSALLSGALLNCAFLAILRAYQVCLAAGMAEFCQQLFILFGLLSMAFSALFILGQRDYKRMLAYSSIEHMGILSFGVGLGGNAVFGALLHALNHSLTKAGLFFVAGNILTAFRTKTVSEVQGILKVLPVSGVLWLAGFLAITGMPPFGVFLSKFIILKAALGQGHYVLATLFLVVLAVIFIGLAKLFIPMAQGVPSQNIEVGRRDESRLSVYPAAVFLVIVFLLGVYVPPALSNVLMQASRMLGGG